MVGRLFAQDAGLYSEIIFASPERRALLKEYLDCASANLEMIANADKAAFEKHFRQVADLPQLVFEIELLKFRRGVCRMHGVGKVDGNVVAEAELMARVMDK